MFRKSPPSRLADGEQNKTIEIFFGTRPEYIKLKPVLDAFTARNIKYKLTYVEQHKELVPSCDYTNKIIINNNTDNRLTSIHASIMHGFNYPASDYTIVQGDTATAAGAALAAFYKGSTVVHIEAGLRTLNNNDPFPEEVNRKIITATAQIHYAPRIENQINLLFEASNDSEILTVGNTVIDNLCRFSSYSKQPEKPIVVVTMHRRENHPLIKEWFEQLENLSIENPDLDFIFPMHLNPKVRKHKDIFKHIKVIDPLEYKEMLSLLSYCHSVITDSGGIQEECTFLNKNCFVCRKTSERPSPNMVLVKTPTELSRAFNKYKNTPIGEYNPFYFGTGNTGELIAEDIYRRVREV